MESNSISGSYVWQRRICHGIRYQKGPVPFPESVEAGVDFNAAFERTEKLDLSLLTNGVIMELCEFAKTVIKSEMYFLFELIAFNFDVGVDPDNVKQRYSYAARLHNKVKILKEQMKLKTQRYQETFLLPEPQPPEELSKYYCPKQNEMDISVLTKHSSSGQSSVPQQTNHAFMMRKPRGIKVKLMTDAFPNCLTNGVTLVIQDTPRPKLDPNLLTIGVAFELLDFSKVLCGTQSQIIQDLVKQNFGHTLEMIFFRLHISKLQDRKNTCLTPESKAAFRKEIFKLPSSRRQGVYKKRKRLDVESEDLPITTKRRSTLRPSYCESPERWEHSNLSYMCPVDFEANTEGVSDAETQLEETLELKQEDEESFLSPVSLHIGGQFSRCSTNAAHQNITGLFSGDAHDYANATTPKLKLWMRRTARSKQILTSSKVNDMFACCRDISLDFNVGSGRKQTLDLQLLTNITLYEVNKFASAMTKSLGNFFLSVLENNFNLFFQDELHQRNFLFYMITKEKLLQNHPCRDKSEFLNRCIKFPDVYKMVNVSNDLQSGPDVQPEPDPAAPDESQETDPASHPYCSKVGINIWAIEPRPPSKKLDVAVLTNGAVLEIVSFVRELCGTAREIVNDILEHNFDINLQDWSTEASQAIQKWYLTQKHVMKRACGSSRGGKWSTTLIIPSGVPEPLPAETEYGPEDSDTGPSAQARNVPVFNGNMHQVPKVECSYDVCQQIGLDLNINSKPGGKQKLDLHVLTRAAVFEIHSYVVNNCNRYVPALYEILDYNFDLSSQNHRKVQFAWSIASQVLAMVSKSRRTGDYMMRAIELPFEVSEGSEIKEEPRDPSSELHCHNEDSEVTFVQELKPVDIEVEVE